MNHAHSKQAHKKSGYRFEVDWPLGTWVDHVFVEYKAARTVPVNIELEAEHHVLNLENVKQILGNARLISVMACGCWGYTGTATHLLRSAWI